MTSMHEWKQVNEGGSKQMRVPGGWLYHETYDDSSAMCFVPDAVLHEAFGLVSTLAPAMFIDVGNPIGMAEEIVRVVESRLKVQYKRGWIHAMQAVKGVDALVVDDGVQLVMDQVIDRMRSDVRFTG